MKQVVYEDDGSIVAVHYSRTDEPSVLEDRSVLSVAEADWPSEFDIAEFAVSDGEIIRV